MKSKTVSSLMILATAAGCWTLSAEAKEWTVWDRQVELMKQVNDSQKNKQLTVDEARDLRKDLADVARKKARMLDKTEDGKLTSDNSMELEKSLNDISLRLKEKRLEKRVEKYKDNGSDKKKKKSKKWWKKK